MHGWKAPPSTEHSNVESASDEVNSNVGVESEVTDGGPEVMVVSGGDASTVNENVAGVVSVFPAASVARTAKVCGPSPNTAVV